MIPAYNVSEDIYTIDSAVDELCCLLQPLFVI